MDQEDYLIDLNDWTPSIAIGLAAREDIELTSEHWTVIELLRRYYDDYQIAPAERVLVKHMRESMGADKGSTEYLRELFPGGLQWQVAKIAGLPKPAC